MYFLFLYSLFLDINGLVSCSESVDESNGPIVQIQNGLIRGYIDEAFNGNHFYAFVGIPYAEPPVGNLRFKDPVPYTKTWNGVFDGTQFPPPLCPQYKRMDLLQRDLTNMQGSEDCLYLNVFTPNVDGSSGRGLPVMVYIHGGAFFSGGSSMYPPQGIMSEDGVILVVIQYRVGFLGFLSTMDAAATGNYGLKDQTESLRWIRRNIAAFGGDPDRVTIFGQSAGGVSVHMQMLTEDSGGLFQRVIMQSGAGNCHWGTAPKAREYAYAIGDMLGCTANAEGGVESSEELIACLTKKSAADIAGASAKVMEFGVLPMAAAPVVDGDYLKAHPLELMLEGNYQKVDLMAGYTRDDGAFVCQQLYSNEEAFNGLIHDFEKYAPPSLGVDSASAAKEIYEVYSGRERDYENLSDELNDLYGDRYFKICMENLKDYYLLGTEDSDASLYWYQFSYRGEQSCADHFPMQNLADIEVSKNWVSHGDELISIFPGGIGMRPLDNKNDIAMAEMVLKLWVNFAKTGNPTPPNGGLNFTWEPSALAIRRHLDISIQPQMKDDYLDEKKKFWRSFSFTENEILNESSTKSERKTEL